MICFDNCIVVVVVVVVGGGGGDGDGDGDCDGDGGGGLQLGGECGPRYRGGDPEERRERERERKISHIMQRTNTHKT